MDRNKLTKLVFFCSFLAFLAMSVPHMAWLFHLYEARNGWLWWLLSYGTAAGIDVVAAWLIYTLASGKALRKGLSVLAVLVLCIYSWYGNLLYTEAHAPTGTSALSSMFLFNVVVTPLIVSAFPVFAVFFAGMVGRVGVTAQETLAEKAIRLEQERAFKMRIKKARKGQVTTFLTGVIDGTVDVVKHARNQLQDTPTGAPIGTPVKITPVGEQVPADHASVNGHYEQDSEPLALPPESKTVSIAEAAVILGVSQSQVRKLRQKGTLRASARNKRLLLKSGVEAYRNIRQEAPSKDRETVTEGLKLSMVEQAMYDALTDNPEEAKEITRAMQENTMEDFIDLLKSRYSQYAEYITPARVARVKQRLQQLAKR